MENENGRSYFFRDLIVKILLVLLFIFLLMWLVPMPNLNPFYDKVFTENLKSMTDAAKGYYTTSRLPKEEGETSKLTLKDMLDNKMIIEFTDSKGNKCDVNKSYVEVTKKDGEYTFKTNLSCGSDEDYTIEYFGCYDVCADGKCETEVVEKPKNETKKVIEYEFSKSTQTKYIEKYLCKEGYTLADTKCVLNSEVEKIEDAKITCLSGYDYNKTTKKCEKTLNDKKDVTIECPNGYTYNEKEKMCLKGTSNEIDASIEYKCSNGTLNSNNKCVISGTKTENAKVLYSCPNGGTLNGTKCIVTNTVENPKTCQYTNWVCSNVTYAAQVDTTSTPTYTRKFITKVGDNYVYQVCTRKYNCVGGDTSTTTSSYDAKVSYSCTNGKLDGTKCIIATTNEVDATKNYKCSVGTLNGTKCIITNVDKVKANYVCKEGKIDGTGTKCLISSIDKMDPTYECSNGKKDSTGTKCVITESTTNTIDSEIVYNNKTNTQYKWARTESLSGWTRTGKTRTVNVTVTSK